MPCLALVLGFPKKQENKKSEKTGKEICYHNHIFADLDMSFDTLASNLRA